MTPKLFRSAEVCDIAQVQPYVLRSWEKEFPGIGVQKSDDSPRLYRQADVDQVLLMSVNPGFGGQTFIPRSESKIRAVRALLDAAGNDAPVSVDGGVDLSNAHRIVAAGAGILIAGQAIFGSGDAERATRELRAQVDGAHDLREQVDGEGPAG